MFRMLPAYSIILCLIRWRNALEIRWGPEYGLYIIMNLAWLNKQTWTTFWQLAGSCTMLYLNMVWCGFHGKSWSLPWWFEKVVCFHSTCYPYSYPADPKPLCLQSQVLMFIPMLLMKIIWWRRAVFVFVFFLRVKTASFSFNFSYLAYLASEMEQNFSFCLEQKIVGVYRIEW